MRFYRQDNHTVMSGLVIRYRTEQGNGEICASRDAVVVQGSFDLSTREDVGHFQELLAQAYVQHTVLAKGNREGLGFQTDPECVYEHRKYRVFSTEYEVIASRNRDTAATGTAKE